MTRLWCNGLWLDALDFSASPTDRGLMLGLGLFETILAVDGRPIHAERHVERLRASCLRLGWKFGFSNLPETMAELVQMNGLASGRARLRLAITGGSGLIHDLALGADHIVWITAVPAADAPLTATVSLSPWLRNERSSLAGLKCASYAENLVALQDAKRRGFEETVFLNTAGQVCEGATSNIFLVRNGEIATPSLRSGCLPGITRSVIIELAAGLGIPWHERDLTLDDLTAADELFLTSSIRGLTGVSRFEDRILPSGPVTRMLRDAWTAATSRKSPDPPNVLH
jgi:branched-subunit amino acid aminotransferase/4-amino-4-deoxychorismate lyase